MDYIEEHWPILAAVLTCIQGVLVTAFGWWWRDRSQQLKRLEKMELAQGNNRDLWNQQWAQCERHRETLQTLQATMNDSVERMARIEGYLQRMAEEDDA